MDLTYLSVIGRRMYDLKTHITELQRNAGRGALDWVLLFISPYLFAVAIAIRITKVTAELRDIPA